MIGARWERVLDNVLVFIEIRDAHAASGGNRCRVTFQLTFLETNVGEIGDIVRLAARLGVDRVKGHHLWAHFDSIRGLSSPPWFLGSPRSTSSACRSTPHSAVPSSSGDASR